MNEVNVLIVECEKCGALIEKETLFGKEEEEHSCED